MIENLVMLASYGYYGGAIGDILNQWANFGAFSYVIPFLLIFALVYGILQRMELFGSDSKAINAIIALAVGLMALQFHFVPLFFSEIFPRTGVALAIFLVVMILAGFFIDPHKPVFRWILIGIGAIITIILLIQTAGNIGWYTGQWWYNNWQMVAFVVFIIVVIGVIVGSSNPSNQDFKWWPMQPVSGSKSP